MNKTTKIMTAAVILACLAVIGTVILYFAGKADRMELSSADKRTVSSDQTKQKTEKKTTQKEKTERRYVIVIDPGHQRKQDASQEPIGPGAKETKPKVSSGTSGVVSGLDEYELTLMVSNKLRTELIKRGYTVHMTRIRADVNISNAERAKFAEDKGADIFIRIHANGSEDHTVRGALSMAPSKNNPYAAKLAEKSQKLSRSVLDEYCRVTGMKNRGVILTDQMSGINWASMPVTILEMGFMSNQKDDLAMKNKKFQKKMAEGTADGIDRYFKEMETEEGR
ncbi:N-acetylmuramoyl-L-alanine amidase family protein [Anaerostipes sp.]|uniref:N-acetylmuramoyl-L-alanine amidase family protein n=1 Tax=Anaerostipes sp. TaxID=1872530 RepID=UPI0025C4C51B|nr:N-acetylmuramoyl-L-alanine amidase [Anaerostipes sp.]MBS7008429.1 N-acetylmuramoyl-L-alanine amidase [Anaerostipes sp.]